MKELIKGSALIFFFKVLGSGAFFVISIMISNYYGAKHLGIFSLLYALFQMTSILSNVGLDVIVVKVIPTLESRERISSFIKKIIRLLLTFSLLCSIIIGVFANYVDEYLFKSIDAKSYIFVTAFLIIPYSFQNVLPQILRGFEEVKFYAIFKNALLNISIILSLIMLHKYASMKNEPILALFIGISIASIITTTFIVLFLRRKEIPLKSDKYGDNILKESIPMFMTTSILFLMSNLDSFMIGYFGNEIEVGFYNACIRLSFAISFILGAIKGYTSPMFSKLYHQNKMDELKQLYKRILKITWISTLPILLSLFLFPTFFLGLFGSEFMAARLTLMILILTFSISTLLGPTGHMLNMTGHQNILMKIILVAFIMNFTGNYFLIQSYGINGAAFASLVSTAFWNLGTFIILKRKKII